MVYIAAIATAYTTGCTGSANSYAAPATWFMRYHGCVMANCVYYLCHLAWVDQQCCHTINVVLADSLHRCKPTRQLLQTCNCILSDKLLTSCLIRYAYDNQLCSHKVISTVCHVLCSNNNQTQLLYIQFP